MMEKNESKKVKGFINEKIKETVEYYIIAFHLNSADSTFGTLRVDKNIQDMFKIENNKSYDIYLKLNNPISDCDTRLVFTKVTNSKYKKS